MENGVGSWPSGLGSRLTAVTSSRVQIPAGACADEIPKKGRNNSPSLLICFGKVKHPFALSFHDFQEKSKSTLAFLRFA